MIFPVVFILSASSIAFEVLLTRIFSISQWHHLSFMVISIALFGFGASGTFLSLLDARKPGWEKSFSDRRILLRLVIFYSISEILAFVVLTRLPLDYFRIPLEPVQTLYLLAAYLLLSIPFFFTGMIMSTGFAALPEKTGLVYCASMTGSAVGAVLPALLLPFIGEGHLIILAALSPLLLPVLGNLKQPGGKGTAAGALITLVVLLGGVYLSPVRDTLVWIRPSPYKALSQVLQFPESDISHTHNSIRGRIDQVQSPYIRFAPGVSLKFTGTLPDQWAAYRDGDRPFVFYHLNGDADLAFPRFSIPYAGYVLTPAPEHVLLIQQGGGAGIPTALAAESRKITVVESSPHITRLVRAHYQLPAFHSDARTFLKQTDQTFSVIQIENWGTSLPGSAALHQEHLFTLDAFSEYLAHLKEGGILILSRKLMLPPSDSVRMWATAWESLRSFGIAEPGNHLAMIRNWDIYTLIVSLTPLHRTEPLREFAERLNFDPVYLPDIQPDEVNRFNIFDDPYHYLRIQELLQAYRTETADDFFRTSMLDIVPQTDRRPFPGRLIRWSHIGDLYRSLGSRVYTLLMSGEIVVGVVFLEALAVAVLLLMLPLFTLARGRGKTSVRRVLYFLGIGAGFMFIEIYFIKYYTLLLGDPIISFTVVLAGILIFSGVGGYLSQMVKKTGLRISLAALLCLLVLILIGLPNLLNTALGFSASARYITAVAILLPVGILMGLPLALGMRYLLTSPVERAYAWAANGCASVLTSIASAQIALSSGIPWILICAIAGYFLALICIRGSSLQT